MQSHGVERAPLYALASIGYPVVGMLALLLSRGWLSHYSDRAWPLILFCIGIPLFLAAVTCVVSRLSVGSAFLLLVTGAVGGVASIVVLLALVAAAGDLS